MHDRPGTRRSPSPWNPTLEPGAADGRPRRARFGSGLRRRRTRRRASRRGGGAVAPATPTPRVAAREPSRTHRKFGLFSWPWPPLLCGLVVMVATLAASDTEVKLGEAACINWARLGLRKPIDLPLFFLYGQFSTCTPLIFLVLGLEIPYPISSSHSECVRYCSRF